jgi:hypothetical protein
LRKIKIAFDLVNENFSFFFNITKLNESEAGEKTEQLRKYYLSDLDLSFPNACLHFRSRFRIDMA